MAPRPGPLLPRSDLGVSEPRFDPINVLVEPLNLPTLHKVYLNYSLPFASDSHEFRLDLLGWAEAARVEAVDWVAPLRKSGCHSSLPLGHN